MCGPERGFCRGPVRHVHRSRRTPATCAADRGGHRHHPSPRHGRGNARVAKGEIVLLYRVVVLRTGRDLRGRTTATLARSRGSSIHIVPARRSETTTPTFRAFRAARRRAGNRVEGLLRLRAAIVHRRRQAPPRTTRRAAPTHPLRAFRILNGGVVRRYARHRRDRRWLGLLATFKTSPATPSKPQVSAHAAARRTRQRSERRQRRSDHATGYGSAHASGARTADDGATPVARSSAMRSRINTATCRCRSRPRGASSPTSRPSRCRRLTSVRKRSASRPRRCCVKKRLQAQSAQIDLLSGATFTSESYAESLQSALDRAGMPEVRAYASRRQWGTVITYHERH